MGRIIYGLLLSFGLTLVVLKAEFIDIAKDFWALSPQEKRELQEKKFIEKLVKREQWQGIFIVIEVAQPREKLFKAIIDFNKFSEYMESVSHSEIYEDGETLNILNCKNSIKRADKTLSSEGRSADEQEPTYHKVVRQIGEHEKELGSLSAMNGCIVKAKLTFEKLFTSSDNYYIHLIDSDNYTVRWYLDPQKSEVSANLFSRSSGYWKLEDMGDGTTRGYYHNEIAPSGWLPDFMVRYILSNAGREATLWLKNIK